MMKWVEKAEELQDGAGLGHIETTVGDLAMSKPGMCSVWEDDIVAFDREYPGGLIFHTEEDQREIFAAFSNPFHRLVVCPRYSKCPRVIARVSDSVLLEAASCDLSQVDAGKIEEKALALVDACGSETSRYRIVFVCKDSKWLFFSREEF